MLKFSRQAHSTGSTPFWMIYNVLGLVAIGWPISTKGLFEYTKDLKVPHNKQPGFHRLTKTNPDYEKFFVLRLIHKSVNFLPLLNRELRIERRQIIKFPAWFGYCFRVLRLHDSPDSALSREKVHENCTSQEDAEENNYTIISTFLQQTPTNCNILNIFTCHCNLKFILVTRGQPGRCISQQ